MKSIKSIAMIFAASLLAINVMAQSSGDIVDVAAGSSDHSTLVAAVKAADLVGTLKSKGPFTVFAPTNDAFAKLPAGTVEGLLKPENKSKLSGLLTYHVVAGNLDAKNVMSAIKKGNGKAVLKTVAGAELTASVENGSVVLTDGSGSKSTVTATDLKAGNGVIHVIDAVLMPTGN
ncbi:MAG: fasciclin domain-containing protein [Chitinophagaceae bacterium]